MATDDIDATPDATVPIGTVVINTYEITGLVNVGGMGEVYRGINNFTQDPVAIKIVLPALAHDPKIIALFQKEAQVLGRLNHDAIVRYHIFTTDPGIGRPCLVMEFVEGRSIYSLLNDGPMPEAEVRALIRRVGSGLHAAHQAGTVHRDLTPSNVILTDGLAEHAKIIDFGIAKSTKMGTGTLLQGQFAGTLGFVSPEQLGAFGGEIDARSDIYSLGLLTAAVCIGQTLDMGESVVEAVNKRNQVPDLTGVYDGLRPLIARMLEPDPANRPGSMEEVIQLMDAGPGTQTQVPHAATPQPDRTIIMPLSTPPSPGATPAAQPPSAPPSPPPSGLGAPPPVTGLGQPEIAAPASSPPAPQPMPTPPSEAPQRSGTSPGIIIGIILLAAISGGYVAYTQGLLPIKPEQFAAIDYPPPGPDDYDPPGPEDYAPEGPDDYAPPGAEDYAPEGAEDYAPPGTGDHAPEGPDDYPPIGSADFAPSGPDDYAPEGPGDYDPPGPDDYAPEGPDDYAPPGPGDYPPEGPGGTAESQQAQRDEAQTTMTRVGQHLEFLDAHNLGPCTYTSVSVATEERVAIAGFGQAVAPFEALVGDFEASRGAILDVGLRLINAPQCAVLDFAGGISQAGSSRPSLTLDRDVLTSGQVISGEAEGFENRSSWLFLVDGDGGTYSLDPLMRLQPDGSARFSFEVRLTQGSDPAPQLMGLIVTDQPLNSVRSVDNGTAASELLPVIAREIDQNNLEAEISLQFFRLEN